MTDWRSAFIAAKDSPRWWIVYKDYMSSKEWASLRKKILRRDKGCRVCGAVGELHVHHRTYERIGAEDMSDLTALCRECHEPITRMLRRRRLRGKVFDNVIGKIPELVGV